jgi:hypothetical protein
MNHSGKIGEAKWKAYLESVGHIVENAPERVFYDWDLKSTTTDKRTVTFEVKYDEKAYYWAEKRGMPDNPNMYIEYKNTNQNRDSGILASKADYYVYILKAEEDIAYVFKRGELCEHLVNAKYKSVGNSATGDDNALGWIPPLKEMVKHHSFHTKINLNANSKT